MVKFTCLCCGHTQEFENGEEAFEAGWDTPGHFTIQPLCNLCPASPIALHGLDRARHRHKLSHERWARDGRPEEYELAEELKLDGQEPISEDELKASVLGMIEKILAGGKNNA